MKYLIDFLIALTLVATIVTLVFASAPGCFITCNPVEAKIANSKSQQQLEAHPWPPRSTKGLKQITPAKAK